MKDQLRKALAASSRPRLLMLSHGFGGGVERHVGDLVQWLRPVRDVMVLRGLGQGGVDLAWYGEQAATDVRLQIGGFSQETAPDWAEALSAMRFERLHLHHLHGWPEAVHELLAKLDLRLDITVHDYALISPRFHFENDDGRFVPDAYVDDAASHAWRERGIRLLRRAERVIVPSRDVAERLRRHIPQLETLIWPHREEPIRIPSLTKVALIGGISEVKGYHVLLDVAESAKAQQAPIIFRVIGHATRPLPPGITATGSYREEDLPRLIAAERADVYWFPSQVPETYNYALSAALASGRPIVASALGSNIERLQNSPAHCLLPHDATPGQWLDALLNAAPARPRIKPSETWPASPYDAEYLLPAGPLSASEPEPLIELLRQSPAAPEGVHHGLHALFCLGRYAGHAASADVIEQQLASLDPGETHVVGRRAYEAVTQHRDALERENQRMQEEFKRLHNQFSQMQQALAEKNQTLAQKDEALVQMQQALTQTQQGLQQQAAHIEHLQGELKQILASRSWRLTRPLRVATRGLHLALNLPVACLHGLRQGGLAQARHHAALEIERFLRPAEHARREQQAMFEPSSSEHALVSQQASAELESSPIPATIEKASPPVVLLDEEFPWSAKLFPERLKSPWWIGHIPFAYELIARQKPHLIVELGTYSGSSFAAFCQALEALGHGGQCVGVDLWQGDVHMGTFEESLYQEMSEFARTRYPDSARLIRKLFDEAVSDFPDASIDLLHIDGTHTYEAVRNDFETWLPKLSSRGIVLFHDVNVTVENVGEAAHRFGVRRFFDEIKPRYPHCEFSHCYGLGVLAVGDAVEPDILKFIERCRAPDVQAHFAARGQRVSDHFAALGIPLPVHRQYEAS